MSPPSDTPILPTVSRALLEDWLTALRDHCTGAQLSGFLDQVGLADHARPGERVTHDQIVRLYQVAAVETGDEMTGLWSRPIRSGALKHLCTSVRGASSLSASLFRFSSFWNLLLDDFELTLDRSDDRLRLSLAARGEASVQRFGHMLLLKLAHGVASWLVGRELRVRAICFAFPRPDFAQDYSILFPAPVRFGGDASSIEFEATPDTLPAPRTERDMQAFLVRAPRDWIFTRYREHALALKVREGVLLSDRLEVRLVHAARTLNLTPRTLIRRLATEGTSFQGIKDGLPRDMAIRDLTEGRKSIEMIAHDIGFASAANFHRAFKRWTNDTPGAYRRM